MLLLLINTINSAHLYFFVLKGTQCSFCDSWIDLDIITLALF